ncbi:MAG: SEL1-like repeat protein, partial [Phenylobacterium sp.]
AQAEAQAGPSEEAPEAEPEAEEPPPVPPERLSARELIEQARLAARTSSPEPRKRKADAEAKPGLFSNFSVARPKRSGKTLPTAVLVAGGVAAASLAIGGALQMNKEPEVADATATQPEALQAGPRAAVALAPRKLAEPEASAGPADANVELLFAQGVQATESGDASGLDKLKQAANLGHAPAQFYLAKLYEAGRGGVKADMAEARKWTERAAQGGERKAMHNLALYYFEGVGGPKNTTLAAQWFQRAAEMGLLDSQYNLGRLYEEGIGVPQNGAEAYRWYLIAGRSGDTESRASAQRVKSQLGSEARIVAERSASSFRPAAPANLELSPDKAAVSTAQRALSRLNYYQLAGPADGLPSPALRMAIARFQSDQGLAATGELDSVTLARLAVFTR